MGKTQTADLRRFLKPFPKQMQETALWLREFVWDLYPNSNELIYDNYNALAVGWSPTDRVGHTFCSIALGRTSGNIHFGFYWGSKIADPRKMLLGKGNQYRYVLVGSSKAFPKAYIKTLLKAAWLNSLAMVKNDSLLRQGLTITKSISVKRRPANKKPEKKTKVKTAK